VLDHEDHLPGDRDAATEPTDVTTALFMQEGAWQPGDHQKRRAQGFPQPPLDQRLARLWRQDLLAQETPPRYRALLDEAVLHRQVGGPAFMQEQLDKIFKSAATEQATVQIIPFDVGEHASTDSNFTFLEFGKLAQRHVVFVEGLFSNLKQERQSETERYREALEYLRDAALSPRDSTRLIIEIRST
jgi:hypothetical protein